MAKEISLKEIEDAVRSTANNFMIEFFNVTRRKDFEWKQIYRHEQACVENIVNYFMSNYKELVEDYATQTVRGTCRKIMNEFKET